jgi:2-polyprenyl-3-methyl-5-hydroxy-6-metoxy-1,4-benzoquinol methylase
MIAMELNLKEIDCPVCDSSNYTILFRDKNRRELFDIETNTVKCKSCGMVYLNPIPDIGQFHAFYEKIYTNGYKNAGKSRLEMMLHNIYYKLDVKSNYFDYDRQIYTRSGFGKKIIDIGCSDGMKLKPFVEKGYEVYGVDVNPKAIGDAKSNIPEGKFICGTIEQANLPKNFFDYVRVDNVFEHIAEPKKFLLTIKGLLKSDGKLVIYVPSISTWQFYVFGKFYSQCWIPFHLNLFSKLTVRLIAQKTGYSIENMYNTSDAWWTILSFRQLLNWKRKKEITFNQNILTYILILIFNYLLYIPTKLGNADMLTVVMKISEKPYKLYTTNQ